LQLGLVLGLLLSIFLGIGLRLGSRLFTDDQDVLHHIYLGIPFVSLTQPINALAFVFDGINYGASDFGYAAYSMASQLVNTYVLLSVFSILFFSHIFVEFIVLRFLWQLSASSS
jgi:Na+-driven multidrug efflux pump